MDAQALMDNIVNELKKVVQYYVYCTTKNKNIKIYTLIRTKSENILAGDISAENSLLS